jgi:hypothetical protein
MKSHLFIFNFLVMQKPGGIIALLDETWYAQVNCEHS